MCTYLYAQRISPDVLEIRLDSLSRYDYSTHVDTYGGLRHQYLETKSIKIA
jgi:hypothetical protein